jgi:glycosyltransferase involved in cell wall biosynthesis
MTHPLRVAFVVQRYGNEIVGGAEALCREVAERLSAYISLQVLTTCAHDYSRWSNHYLAGQSQINGVDVWRFPVERERDRKIFDRLSSGLVSDGPLHGFPLAQTQWMIAQGPQSPALLSHINAQRHHYDVFVFFTYLYYSTYFGLPLVPNKSILIPTAHDEPPIHFEMFRSLFLSPRALIYLTDAERAFVHSTFLNADIPSAVIGMGVEEKPDADAERFRAETGIRGPFVAYAGRISASKNCPELLEFYLRYQAAHPESDLSLVLLGNSEIDVPDNPNVKVLGFVSERTKHDAFKAARAVIMPSEFESFSIASLEAMVLGTPLLANGRSLALREHCERSEGGLFYRDYAEFAAELELLVTHEALRDRLGSQARSYVLERYPWARLQRSYLEMIEQVASTARNQVPH